MDSCTALYPSILSESVFRLNELSNLVYKRIVILCNGLLKILLPVNGLYA